MAPLQKRELEKYSSEQRNGSSYGQFADRQLAMLTTAFSLQFHDARYLMGDRKKGIVNAPVHRSKTRKMRKNLQHMLKYRREPQGRNALPDLREHKTRTQPGRGARKPQSELGQFPSWSMHWHAASYWLKASEHMWEKQQINLLYHRLSQKATQHLASQEVNKENSWKLPSHENLESSESREKQGGQTLSSVPTTRREHIKKITDSICPAHTGVTSLQMHGPLRSGKVEKMVR